MQNGGSSAASSAPVDAAPAGVSGRRPARRPADREVHVRQLAAGRLGPTTRFDLENPVDLGRFADPGLELRPLRGWVVLDEIQRLPNAFLLLCGAGLRGHSRGRPSRGSRSDTIAERMETSAGGLEARIAQAVAVVDGVGTVALFGSHATNRARPDSDLDVAVLPTKADPACRRRLVSRVAAALAGLAPGGRVDVVLVDEAPELLRQRIFEHGRLVMQRNPADRRAWRVRTMREHGDREPYRRMLRNAQARRLAAGGIGGRSGRALDSLERARGLSG